MRELSTRAFGGVADPVRIIAACGPARHLLPAILARGNLGYALPRRQALGVA